MITLDQLKQKLAAGQISRRGFMEGALALGATVAGAELMMGYYSSLDRYESPPSGSKRTLL